MRHLYVAILVVCFVGGGFLGYRLAPGPRVREIPAPVETSRVETRTLEVIRTKDGATVERTIVKTEDAFKVSPKTSKPQYRLGALLPIASELKLPTVIAGRRLFGDVWLEAQFDARHKEATLGFSYEF